MQCPYLNQYKNSIEIPTATPYPHISKVQQLSGTIVDTFRRWDDKLMMAASNREYKCIVLNLILLKRQPPRFPRLPYGFLSPATWDETSMDTL